MRMLSLLLVMGCAESTGGLMAPPVDPGPGPGLPDPLTACERIEQDRTTRDLVELHRLALMDSSAIVSGRLDAAGRLTIAKVHVGMSFLEGVTVAIDPEPFGPLSLPADVVIGFGPQLPAYDDEQEVVWWDPRVIIPGDAPGFEGLLSYRPEPLIAEVRIVSQDEDRTYFELVDAIAGVIPQRFGTNWSERRPVNRPTPGETTYLVTMKDVAELGWIVDFRPHSPAEVATVRAAIANPPPSIDPDRWKPVQRDQVTGWRFHRSENVVAAEVLGIAGECCTGAGGMYVLHAVNDDFLGGYPHPQLMRGGHAYYSEEMCGDRSLFGLGEVPGPPEPEASFSCEPWQEGLITGLPVPQTRARIRDTAENRAQVTAWLDSPLPIYQLHLPTVEAPPGGHGAWSSPLDVEGALGVAGAALAWIDVRSVTEVDGGVEVLLGTNFFDSRPDHLPILEVKIVAPCIDPRMRPGTEWLVPFHFDQNSWSNDWVERVEAGDGFIVPGVMLPRLPYVSRIVSNIAVEFSHDPLDPTGNSNR